ncbi:MAG: toll/interleukin-1 receptor domain-containing protein [Defluviitaleaceae bacterium]|nr:toll/interleukin-1 receptor domain-containing protein [Defluviitaleaceae bacterium]MCL2273709.1 toll/interleukin-1 receptor domain-containing protein [Defluviitaleaceae bacterium]
MNKKIFISYLTEQTGLAERLRNLLNKAFNEGSNGGIEFFLAPDKLNNGDNWREEIRALLDASEAGLFLFTPQFLKQKDWLVAEYMCFWFAKKRRYGFTFGNASVEKFPATFDKDIQVHSISDVKGLKSFINSISTDILEKNIDDGSYAPPLHAADNIAKVCTELFNNYQNPEEASDIPSEYKFTEQSITWTFTLNERKTHLNAQCGRCLGIVSNANNLPLINIPLQNAKKYDYTAFNITHNRPAGCKAEVHADPNSNEQFFITFTPKLKKGEQIEVSLSYDVENYKFATQEEQAKEIVKRLQEQKFSKRKEKLGLEQLIIPINNPIDAFSLTIIFPESYKINNKPIEPYYLGEIDHEEMTFIQENNCETADNEKNVYTLKRMNPKFKERYNFSWELPSEDDMG